MAVAGGTMPANMVKLQDGIPVVRHRENRPAEILQQDVEAAEAILRSGLHAWVPSSMFIELRDRMAPQGALADTPVNVRGRIGKAVDQPYLQYDDGRAAEGPPVYDSRTCAEIHNSILDRLYHQLETAERRLEALEAIVGLWTADT